MKISKIMILGCAVLMCSILPVAAVGLPDCGYARMQDEETEHAEDAVDEAARWHRAEVARVAHNAAILREITASMTQRSAEIEQRMQERAQRRAAYDQEYEAAVAAREERARQLRALHRAERYEQQLNNR